MSKSTKNKISEESIAQFCGVTGASVKDAKKYLDKYKRPDIAIDAFYSDGGLGFASSSTFARKGDTASMVLKLNQLFDKYKDAGGDDITVEGTIKLCEDLKVDPEDVVLLAVAYELKSPRVGEWSRRGWVDGWKSLGCDSVTAMRTCLQKLRDRLSSDQAYFRSVYNYTFDFARTQGQRSLAVDTAIAFWSLLLPHGLKGKALSCVDPAADSDSEDEDEDGDVDMDNNIRERGWKEEYNDWWFEFLNVKGGRGVSKDTWTMFLEFIRTIDSKFEKYDVEAAWPSSIDDFVEFAKEKLASRSCDSKVSVPLIVD